MTDADGRNLIDSVQPLNFVEKLYELGWPAEVVEAALKGDDK